MIFFGKVAHLISPDFSYIKKKIAKKELTIMLYNNMMILPLLIPPTFPVVTFRCCATQTN